MRTVEQINSPLVSLTTYLRVSATVKNFPPSHVLFFAALLLLPSVDIPLKYFGIGGLAGYLALGTVGVFVCYYWLLPVILPRLSEQRSAVLLVGLISILAIYSFAIYPTANSGHFGGGTDVDDAMVIGVNEILSGRYPYYQKTYLGGLLSPMPGTLFLALPFVVLGVLPLQNVFWVATLALTARYILKSYVPALMIVLTVFLTSPTAYQVLGTSSDHISNAIYVLISMWLLITAVSDSTSSTWTRILPAILLGIGLSSRSNFLVLTPLLFSVLTQVSDVWTAIRYCVLTGLIFLAATIPFWAYDPAGFSPYLIQAGRLHNIETVFPYASMIIPAATFVVSGMLCFTRMPADGAAFFRNCAVVQLVALYVSSLAYTVYLGKFDLFLGNIGYGMFTVFFAAVSAWIFICKSRASVHASRLK